MSRITGALSTAGRGFAGWTAKYLIWLFLTATVTLGGALLLMLVKDWTLKSVLTSLMAWPVLGLAMLVAGPIALLPVGRLYLGTAVGGGLLYNLILLVA
jgi:hypothetical protein